MEANIYCLKKLLLYLEITILFHFEIYTMEIVSSFLELLSVVIIKLPIA